MSKREDLLLQAKSIVDSVGPGNPFTKAQKEQVERLLEDAEDQKVLDRKLNQMLNGGRPTNYTVTDGGGSLVARLKSSGWNPHSTAPFMFESKAIIGDPADAGVRIVGGIDPMGIDSRYAYSVLRRQNLDGDVTQLQELVQTSRTFPTDITDMQITFGGSDTKPETTVGVTLQTFNRQPIATVSELLPLAITQISAFETLVDNTLRQAYRASLDDYAVTQLVAQAGTFDASGADLFEQLRKAVTSLQGLGYSPTVALVSPEDAEELDLSRAIAGDGGFLLPPSPRASGFSPLWSLRIVPSPAITDPIVLDTSGQLLYTGDVAFAANPFEGFRTNQVRFRLEGDVILVVTQPESIHVVAES